MRLRVTGCESRDTDTRSPASSRLHSEEQGSSSGVGYQVSHRPKQLPDLPCFLSRICRAPAVNPAGLSAVVASRRRLRSGRTSAVHPASAPSPDGWCLAGGPLSGLGAAAGRVPGVPAPDAVAETSSRCMGSIAEFRHPPLPRRLQAPLHGHVGCSSQPQRRVSAGAPRRSSAARAAGSPRPSRLPDHPG